MKILIIHYRYYPVSGPERYLFNIIELLKSRGHTVIPFSINYKNNIPSEFEKYFIEPIGDKNGFSYSKQADISLLNKIKIALNFFYNKNAYKKLNELIKSEKPDIAYVLQFQGKLSISIFDACINQKIPVVLRLSDYGLICSKNTFFRNGEVCTKCISNQFYSLKYKCVHHSFLKSLLNYLVLQFSYVRNFQTKINHFITPSLTMKEIFKGSKQFNKNQITHIPTFFLTKDLTVFKKNINNLQIDFCYVGRIDEDKGVDIIIKAVSILKKKKLTPKILIAGDINNSYAKSLIDLSRELNLQNVEFAGFMEKEQLLTMLSFSKFSIISSMWFDNMPNSLIESQSVGTPVIASNIGSLPELVTDNYNGLLFKTGDAYDLAQKMGNALDLSKSQLDNYKHNSYKWAIEYCSEESHYDKLIYIFENAIRSIKG